MHRAVHGLEVILLASLRYVAFFVAFLVNLHGWEHRVRVVRQVAGSVEQTALRDLGGVNEVEAKLLVAFDHILLNLVTQDAPLGVEDDKAGANFLREGEQIKFCAQATVIATFGFLDTLLVGDEVVLRGPRSAVDTLQVISGLVALPLGG